MYDAGWCSLFDAEIPSLLPSWDHRICSAFAPIELYEKYLETASIDERFSWFNKTLEKGVLYKFPYNVPPEIEELKNLR